MALAALDAHDVGWSATGPGRSVRPGDVPPGAAAQEGKRSALVDGRWEVESADRGHGSAHIQDGAAVLLTAVSATGRRADGTDEWNILSRLMEQCFYCRPYSWPSSSSCLRRVWQQPRLRVAPDWQDLLGILVGISLGIASNDTNWCYDRLVRKGEERTGESRVCGPEFSLYSCAYLTLW